MRSRLARSLFILATLSLTAPIASCARNAIIEIELTLPPLPAGQPPTYAVVMVVDDEHDFDSVNIEPQNPGTLLGDRQQEIYLSVVTERPDGAMRMVVYFCSNTVCEGGDVPRLPQVRYRFVRATYIGHRTRWRGRIDAIPPAGGPFSETCVDRCEIEGCIEGSGTFCRSEDGTHYCQERGEPIGVAGCSP